jgi:CubicO group peptidase (beta-lactamase class C family)
MRALYEAFIKRAIENSYFPGAVVYVEQKGETVYHEGFGYASMFPEMRLMDKDMIFDLASITKIFTTTLVLKLIDEEKIKLQTKVNEHIPELGEVAPEVTIEHLLCHTSGFPAWYPFYTQKEDFFTCLTKMKGVTIPDVQVEYSDLNFIILGIIIEKIESATLDHIVIEKLSKPLQMKTIQYRPPTFMKHQIVATELGNQIEKQMVRERNLKFERWRTETIWGEVNDGNSYYYLKGVSGHAGLFANVHDLAKLARIYLQHTNYPGSTRYLSSTLINSSYQNHTIELGSGRGLGWHLSDTEREGFGHTGFTGTSLWIVPDKQLIMILLTNRLHNEKPKSITAIRNQFHQLAIKSSS